ncbi:amino acid adenylation domain-containing protein, partial [Ascidiimonas sp. W6]|uniref:non-ribosomal peptide synthetase n=1 Tax=Ascidiimonas meishanensis TaxID=3128903 RepID=UPI0030EBC9CE
MNVKKNLEIIRLAREQGIQLFAENGKLGMKKMKTAQMKPELLDLIKSNKDSLVSFFEKEVNGIKGRSTTEKLRIKKSSIQENIPMSFTQERLWFIDQLNGSTNYHVSGVLRVEGRIEIKQLQNAVKKIVGRHESLRTVFKEEEGIGFQLVIPEDDFEVDVKDVSEIEKEQTVEDFLKSEIICPFDLSSDYMIRVTILKKAADLNLVLIVMHHIASDGWSLPIFMNELQFLYAENKNKLPELHIQYKDYSIWQRKHLSGKVLENKLDFWENQLKGSGTLELPTDFTRPVIQSMEGASYSFDIGEEHLAGLKKLARENQCTLFITLLAIYKVFLYKYSGQEDLCVGTPIVNREQPEIASLIGFFVNTIAIRSQIESKKSFHAFLKNVKEHTFNGYMHQDVPFDRVVDRLVSSRDRSRNPLFQTTITYQEAANESLLKLGDATLQIIDTPIATSKFDLSLGCIERDKKLEVEIQYCTALFKEATIIRMANHFNTLIKSVLKGATQPIEQIEILSEPEKELLLIDFNRTGKNFDKNLTVLDLFSKQVILKPGAIAVEFEDCKISYYELEDRSDRLANYLLDLGVTKEELIPISIKRSPELLISILAVMKSGCAYVPIDTKYPRERIDFMLDDTNARFLICDSSFTMVDEKNAALDIICVDLLESKLFQKENLLHKKKGKTVPEQLAYVIYTSGTTGRPKGVMIQHQALFNFVNAIQEKLDFSSYIRMVSSTNFTFDISIMEYFLPLCFGGTIILTNELENSDPDVLQQLISRSNPTHIQATPSKLEMLSDIGWKNSNDVHILSGGEPLKEQLKERLLKLSKNSSLWNLYGPTEATIWSNTKRILPDEQVTIGKALANTQMYILTKGLSLVPVGVTGELHIGGVQLAKAYLNREELTKERFIKSPFDANEILYKTGDLARWLPNGDIEMIGRNDDQIKLRGHRIELGEIAAALEDHSNVKQAIVLCRDNEQGDKYLVAYTILETEMEKASLRSHLSGILPEYMVPRFYV